jgi:hypothetical protein
MKISLNNTIKSFLVIFFFFKKKKLLLLTKFFLKKQNLIFLKKMTSLDDEMSIDIEDQMDTSSRPSSKKVKIKHPGPKQRSHVHEHFKQTTEGHQCQVKGSDNNICGHIINEGGTTSNRSRHLVVAHKILPPQEKEKVLLLFYLNSIN